MNRIDPEPCARIDDLARHVSLRFFDCERAISTNDLAGVIGVLAEAERAADSGRWAVGFVSYEAAAGLDRTMERSRLSVNGSDRSSGGGLFSHRELPLAWFGIFKESRSVPSLAESQNEGGYCSDDWQSSMEVTEHRTLVERIRNEIKAGEVYQVNLTLRYRSKVFGDLFSCYRDLALMQGGSHNVFLDTGRFVVSSASPELFFEWSDEEITTRPMKGTVGRGRTPEDDEAIRKWLVSSEKNQAENVMIVDLLRNDLGRIAEFGSVTTPKLFALERFETLWQLTSTVRARPRAGVGLVDIFRALFPSGSVTGAPKYRAMHMIDLLEPDPRGLYCGAIGFVGPPDARVRARFNVAIRTLVVDRSTGAALYGTGGGITVASQSDEEYLEARTKAAILGRRPEGFALVETMAYIPGFGVRYRDDHLERLARGAVRFGFAWNLDEVVEQINAAVLDERRPMRLRLLLHRAGKVEVERTALEQAPSDTVRIAIDDDPIDSADPFLQFKTTRRQNFEVRSGRHPEADDVLLLNERGELTEATIANLLVWIDGRWWTPPLSSGCLPGVARARLVRTGIVRERVLFPDDIREGSAIGLVSSLRGFRRAELLPSAPT